MSEHRRSLGVYEDVLNQLKAKGIRLTESRKAVIRYLMMSDQHPSADVIYYDLLPDNPGMSLATVYNNLKVLVEEGLSLKSRLIMIIQPIMILWDMTT